MRNKHLCPELKYSDDDEEHFQEFLQERINRLCWLVNDPVVKERRRNFLRVAIVTKHALIDFSRILKGRRSALESFYRGEQLQRESFLIQQLRNELVSSGLAQARREQQP